MKVAEREQMYQDIEQHGKNLNAIFNTGLDPVALCKKLHKLENMAHRLTTELCNGLSELDTQYAETEIELIKNQVNIILNNPEGFFVNRDPRGYALKINDQYIRDNNLTIYRDYGGYGIIAPDFTPDS